MVIFLCMLVLKVVGILSWLFLFPIPLLSLVAAFDNLIAKIMTLMLNYSLKPALKSVRMLYRQTFSTFPPSSVFQNNLI